MAVGMTAAVVMSQNTKELMATTTQFTMTVIVHPQNKDYCQKIIYKGKNQTPNTSNKQPSDIGGQASLSWLDKSESSRKEREAGRQVTAELDGQASTNDGRQFICGLFLM